LLGVQGENYWIHDELDQDSIGARRLLAHEGEVPLCFLSFPSLKDPEARCHTAEVTTAVDPAAFERWAGTRWMKRGEDYTHFKQRIADALLARVEQYLPGFQALIEYSELSTPLSNEHFTAHPRGEIYGIPATPERFRKSYLQVRTKVKNLLMTGADALSPGVVGAASAGLLCAVAATGPSTFAKLSAAAKRLRNERRATAVGTCPSIA
jgi:phytoene dehydrogenase-like protein